MITYNEYIIRKNYPLEFKVKKSLKTIEEFYKRYGKFYISVGGLDSTVLLYLTRLSKIEGVATAPAYCIPTCENPKNLKANYENDVNFIKPKYSKKYVYENYGFPFISKEVAMKISRYLRSKSPTAKERRLKGYMGNNGKWCYASKIPNKYVNLIYAPFELSAECCVKQKESPLKKLEKDFLPLIGELAEESDQRLKTYLKNGCIMSSAKRIKCCPLEFWQHKDILEFCKKYNVHYSKEYGEIKQDEEGNYYNTGEQRTGCLECGFGILYDLDRFVRLKKNYPLQYNHLFRKGKWIRKKNRYRWVIFKKGHIKIWSNLYYGPSDNGFGYKFIIDYLNEVLGTKILY